MSYEYRIYIFLAVLIESDWNLKQIQCVFLFLLFQVSINRIRLEFKDFRQPICRVYRMVVLIESDWNLKRITFLKRIADALGINRIRLEFKVIQTVMI